MNLVRGVRGVAFGGGSLQRALPVLGVPVVTTSFAPSAADWEWAIKNLNLGVASIRKRLGYLAEGMGRGELIAHAVCGLAIAHQIYDGDREKSRSSVETLGWKCSSNILWHARRRLYFGPFEPARKAWSKGMLLLGGYNPEPEPEEEVPEGEANIQLWVAFAQLKPPDQEVLKRKLGLGCEATTFKAIAAEWGVSLERIRQRYERGILTLRKLLGLRITRRPNSWIGKIRTDEEEIRRFKRNEYCRRWRAKRRERENQKEGES